MSRVATPLVVSDLSSFARALGRAWSARHAAAEPPPTHVELQNLIARAAGYRNLQALKAAPPAATPDLGAAPAAPALSDNARRTLMQFDTDGRLVRWPTKFTVQRMAMWILWTHFDGKRVYTEREVNAVLKAANGFDDHATLRRELVNHRLLARKSDCSEYRKLPARPDGEVRALLSAWRAGTGERARTVRRSEAARAAPRARARPGNVAHAASTGAPRAARSATATRRRGPDPR